MSHLLIASPLPVFPVFPLTVFFCPFFGRSPSTPELSTDELPDDITNEMADIPNDLELNQEDFSDVLPRLADDLQDFDLFEGLFFLHHCALKRQL